MIDNRYFCEPLKKFMKHPKLKSLLTLFILLYATLSYAQYISVDGSYTDEQLVKKIFIGDESAGCITVSNISITGYTFGTNDKSYGYFNKSTSNFQIQEGIILTSGNAKNAEGSNVGIQSVDPGDWGGDRDLEEAANISRTTNATILEFDFISNQSNKISFEYMFLSEQYLRQNDPGTCGYTDAFAFLIKKIGDARYTNLAVLPGTNTPITSNNVRGEGGKCPASNSQYFGQFNPDGSATNFNGQTKILTATSQVVPGEKYHIKLIIADQGNGLYDSGVFLKAGSFVGNVSLGPDRLYSNGTALCEGQNLLLNINAPSATNIKWFKDGAEISGHSSTTYNVTNAGIYEVEYEISGCKLKGSITIEYATLPILQEKTFAICDDKLAGPVVVNLQNYNSEVLVNYDSHFDVNYYANATDAAIGNSNILPTNFSFTGDTTIYARAFNGNCASINYKPIHLKIGSKIALNTPLKQFVCDNELNYSVEIDLSSYLNLFTTESGITVRYFASQADASDNVNAIAQNQTITSSRRFYYRFETSSKCPNIGFLDFEIKKPLSSSSIKDEFICPSALAQIDAGLGFTYYAWFDENNPTVAIREGASESIVLLPIGSYFVDLYSNGCVYRQSFKVSLSQAPIITHIDVDGNTAVVHATGGTAPYSYSVDNINFQSSNIFTNMPRGLHKVYVKSAEGCHTTESEFLILNLINVITPNDDGYNDVLDYSDLRIKNNVKIQIYNSLGAKVFESTSQNYIWNGKTGGRAVSTGTYWYLLTWEEPGTAQIVNYTGWILVKNRN